MRWIMKTILSGFQLRFCTDVLKFIWDIQFAMLPIRLALIVTCIRILRLWQTLLHSVSSWLILFKLGHYHKYYLSWNVLSLSPYLSDVAKNLKYFLTKKLCKILNYSVKRKRHWREGLESLLLQTAIKTFSFFYLARCSSVQVLFPIPKGIAAIIHFHMILLE